MLHVRTHLLEACRWATEAEVEAAEIAAAALGMAIPMLFAVIGGNLAPGLAAAIGGLIVGRIDVASGLRAHLRHQAEALAPAILAALLAVICAGRGWVTAAALVLLVAIAATLSGLSRAAAVAATRFTLFLMIVSAVATPTKALEMKEAIGLLALVTAGALWTSALSLVLARVVRRSRNTNAPASPLQPVPTPRQKYSRWLRSLATFAGWIYPARLSSGIAFAFALDVSWPGHHLHWIGLTLAILTQRQVELVPVKTTQRALGTAIGIMAAGILPRAGLTPWALVGAVAFLAGIRPLLRVKNYLGYSAVMTPLIILIVDAGRAPDNSWLFDRLIATLIGAALVVAINMLVLRLFSPHDHHKL